MDYDEKKQDVERSTPYQRASPPSSPHRLISPLHSSLAESTHYTMHPAPVDSLSARIPSSASSPSAGLDSFGNLRCVAYLCLPLQMIESCTRVKETVFSFCFADRVFVGWVGVIGEVYEHKEGLVLFILLWIRSFDPLLVAMLESIIPVGIRLV